MGATPKPLKIQVKHPVKLVYLDSFGVAITAQGPIVVMFHQGIAEVALQSVCVELPYRGDAVQFQGHWLLTIPP